MKLFTIFTLSIAFLISAALLKGHTHYIGIGFNWTGRTPQINFSHGKGWAVSYRADLNALRELVSTMSQELRVQEIQEAVK